MATVVKHNLATTDAQISSCFRPAVSVHAAFWRFCVSDYGVRLSRNGRLDRRGDCRLDWRVQIDLQLLIDL